jgi:hypothetical protein
LGPCLGRQLIPRLVVSVMGPELGGRKAAWVRSPSQGSPSTRFCSPSRTVRGRPPKPLSRTSVGDRLGPITGVVRPCCPRRRYRSTPTNGRPPALLAAARTNEVSQMSMRSRPRNLQVREPSDPRKLRFSSAGSASLSPQPRRGEARPDRLRHRIEASASKRRA